MGFSLEAIAVIPCCLSILAHSTALSEPAATGFKETASLTALAASRTGEETASIRHLSFELDGASIPGLDTRPQKMIEAMSLARDSYRLLTGQGQSLPDDRP